MGWFSREHALLSAAQQRVGCEALVGDAMLLSSCLSDG